MNKDKHRLLIRKRLITHLTNLTGTRIRVNTDEKRFYNFPATRKQKKEGIKMKTFGKWTIWGVFFLFAATLLGPGQTLAAPKGQLVNALSTDISTLDTQYHNIRVNYIVGWHLYDNLVYRDQKT
jgi:hypothetical protein